MLTHKLSVGQVLIVHLTNAMSDDTAVEIHYSPKSDACQDIDFAPIRRAGSVLTLSPMNSPLVLELAGTYRFEALTPDTTANIHVVNVTSLQQHGDIMSQTAYSVSEDL